MKKYILLLISILFVGCVTQDENVKKDSKEIEIKINDINKTFFIDSNYDLNIELHFNTEKEQKEYFKSSLKKVNILSAQITFSLIDKNNSNSNINLIFRRQDFKMNFENNERYALDTLKVFEKNSYIAGMSSGMSGLGGLPGLFVFIINEHNKNQMKDKMYNSFLQFDFNERILNKDKQKIGGFLFFDLESIENVYPTNLIIEYEDERNKMIKEIKLNFKD